MGFIFGGPTAWKVRKKGDLVIAYHWINGEPAMCLYPLRKRLGSAVYAIPMARAHEFVNRKGYPTPYLAEASVKAAIVMAMEQDKSTLYRIRDVILDGMEDLIKMPPDPQQFSAAAQKAIGEATLFVNGKKSVTGEITAGSAPPSGMLH